MMLSKLVMIQGIKSRPELNGQLGIASTFDSATDRYVDLLEGLTRVALKGEPLGVDVTRREFGGIKAADTADRLLALCKSGALMSEASGEDAYAKLLKPEWRDDDALWLAEQKRLMKKNRGGLEDCGQCISCLDMIKFGGTGTRKQACVDPKKTEAQQVPDSEACVLTPDSAKASIKLPAPVQFKVQGLPDFKTARVETLVADNWREMLDGGIVEMCVYALDAHIADRKRILCTVRLLSTLLTKHNDRTERSLSVEMKDRAVAAGYYERLCKILKAHTTSDIQTTVLGALGNCVSGGAFLATEARRNAAVRSGALDAVVAAMKLAPHSSAVQHFGVNALHSICAWGAGLAPDTSRLDSAIRAGAHLVTLEAIRRFGHMRSDNGVSKHTMEESNGPKVTTVYGSIMEFGLGLISYLAYDGNNVKALNDAGTLKVIAGVLRADSAIMQGDKFKLEPLVMKLLGNSNVDDLLDKEDHATLVGTAASPGLLLMARTKKENEKENAMVEAAAYDSEEDVPLAQRKKKAKTAVS